MKIVSLQRYKTKKISKSSYYKGGTNTFFLYKKNDSIDQNSCWLNFCQLANQSIVSAQLDSIKCNYSDDGYCVEEIGGV